jgi:hypothetical protein
LAQEKWVTTLGRSRRRRRDEKSRLAAGNWTKRAKRV